MTKMVLTLWVPFLNVKNFVVTRPPAVVFAFCVASFGIATLGLSLYVKHTSSPLSDPDEFNWNDVATKFNRVKFCTHPTDVKVNTTGMEAFSVPFDMVTPLAPVWSNFTLISGTLSATDLGFHDNPGANLSFSFSLMQPLNKICLSLFHPPEVVLPKVVSPCHALQDNVLPKAIGAFVLPREEKRPSQATLKCDPSSFFDLKLVSNPEWTVLLSQDDRTLVSLHLMATSAFLLTTFLMMLCFAAVRGSGQRNNRASVKMVDAPTAGLLLAEEPLNP